MEVQQLYQELDDCRYRITRCIEQLHGINDEQVDNAMDVFIEGIKQDLQALRNEGRTPRARSAHYYTFDLWEQSDLVCLDGVSPDFSTKIGLLQGQKLRSSQSDYDPDFNFSDIPDRPNELMSDLTMSGCQRQNSQAPAARPASARSSFTSPMTSHQLLRNSHDAELETGHASLQEPVYREETLENLAVDGTKTKGLVEAHVNDTFGQQSKQLSSFVGHNFEEVASQTVFEDFCLAVRYIRRSETLKLPTTDAQISAVLTFLERVQGADFACDIYHRMGLWRLHGSYKQLQEQIRHQRATMTNIEKRVAKTGKCTSQALSALLQTSRVSATTCHGYGSADVDHLKTRMQNFLSSGRSWSILCESASSGILCLIPRMASSRFERLRGGVITNFVQSLKSLREDEIWPLSALLSPHLEAILEGNECLLGVMIENGSLGGWSDVLAHNHQLSACPHLRTDL